MTVKFYNSFYKRRNSTKQLTGTETAYSHDCKLKANCSEHDPVLILASNDYSYTYAFIQNWAKWYFVTDAVSLANGLIEYHLTEDVLATYRSDIGNTKAHIAFSSNGYDPMIIDPRIQVKNSRQMDYSEDTTAVFGGGCYILSVFNDQDMPSNGAAASYCLTPTGMKKVRKWMCSSSIFAAIANDIHGEPIKSIFSCIYVPYSIPTSGAGALATPVSYVYVGEQSSGLLDTTVPEAAIIESYPIISKTFTLACHLRYSDFRAYEPYTSGNIFLPGIGLVDVNMGDFRGSSSIKVRMILEVVTGNVTYHICDSTGLAIIQTLKCNVACQTPLGQMVLDGSGVMNGIGTVVGGAAALVGAVVTEGGSLAIGAAAGAMVAGAANTALAANRRASSISGGNSGFRTIAAFDYCSHYEYSQDTEDPDAADYIATRGRPYGGVSKIKDLFDNLHPSGYVQCEGGSVDSLANSREKDEINTFLNGGFYYE